MLKVIYGHILFYNFYRDSQWITFQGSCMILLSKGINMNMWIAKTILDTKEETSQ